MRSRLSVHGHRDALYYQDTATDTETLQLHSCVITLCLVYSLVFLDSRRIDASASEAFRMRRIAAPNFV